MKTPLREAHAHLPMLGRELSMLHLEACTSCEACLELLSAAAGKMALEEARGTSPKGGWLVAVGARMEGWSDRRWPTRRELDARHGSRPVVVMSFDHHALVANTAALSAAGISRESMDPPGGVIVREKDGVTPTGLLLESAARLVRGAIPEPSWAQKKADVKAALAELSRHGFVEVDDLLAPPWLGRALAELHDEEGLGLKVGLYPPLDGFDEALSTREAWERPLVKLKGAKLFADGTLNSRTAWMLKPYADGMKDHPCGTALLTVDEIALGLARCRRAGLELAVHAIGDGAVRACLDAAERVLGKTGAGPGRLRIEHCELVDEADVGRFAAMEVTCSVQPCHLLYDVEALERGCPERLERVLPLRELLESGLKPGRGLVFGSDVPIVRCDPGDSIVAAVERRRVEGSPGGKPTGAIAARQALTEGEAWACFSPQG